MLTEKTRGYRLCSWAARMICTRYCQLRIEGMENIPATGRAVLVSNHVSYLDVMIIGGIAKRHVSFMARGSLARFRFMRWVIDVCGAIPVDPKSSTVTIRQAIQHLEAEDLVAVFPEGTRSKTGQLGKFQRGFQLIATKTKSPIVPVGISGAYEAWPPSKLFPKRGQLMIRFGPPISHDTPNLEEAVYDAVCNLSGAGE